MISYGLEAGAREKDTFQTFDILTNESFIEKFRIFILAAQNQNNSFLLLNVEKYKQKIRCKTFLLIAVKRKDWSRLNGDRR